MMHFLIVYYDLQLDKFILFKFYCMTVLPWTLPLACQEVKHFLSHWTQTKLLRITWSFLFRYISGIVCCFPHLSWPLLVRMFAPEKRDKYKGIACENVCTNQWRFKRVLTVIITASSRHSSLLISVLHKILVQRLYRFHILDCFIPENVLCNTNVIFLVQFEFSSNFRSQQCGQIDLIRHWSLLGVTSATWLQG